jgi:hypothetical protein
MERRLALLQQLDDEGRSDNLRALVEAFVEPLYDMSVARPNSTYARFLAQAYRNAIVIPLISEERGLREGYRDWLRRVEPHLTHLPEAVKRLRVDQVASMTIHTLAYWEGGQGDEALPLVARLEDLIDSCVAVLEAPTSDSTRAMLRAAHRQRAEDQAPSSQT